MNPKLTLSMIVKNEGKYLRGALESVQSATDEIVVVDTGSTDNTIKIAEEFGAKVFHFDWVNDFSAARNYALSKSTGDWILYLDADERITPNSLTELKRIVNQNTKAGVWCLLYSDDKVKKRYDAMHYVRLFKNSSKIKFTGKAHEQIYPSLEKENYRFIKSNITIEHLGYSIDEESFKKKAERNLEMLLSQFEEKEESYTAFQIAQSYAILNKENEAAHYFSIAVTDKNLGGDYLIIALRYLAGVKQREKNIDEAYNLINKALDLKLNQPLVFVVAADIYSEKGLIKEADNLYRKAVDENIKLTNHQLNSSYALTVHSEILILKAINFATKNRLKESFNYYLNQLKKVNDSGVSKTTITELELLEILFNQKEITENEILKYVSSVSESNVELILVLLNEYSNTSRDILLLELYKKYPHIISLAEESAAVLGKYGKFSEAVNLLESNFRIDQLSIKSIFNLISFHLQLGNYDQLLNVIEYAENKFAGYNEIENKIKQIKERILIYIK